MVATSRVKPVQPQAGGSGLGAAGELVQLASDEADFWAGHLGRAVWEEKGSSPVGNLSGVLSVRVCQPDERASAMVHGSKELPGGAIRSDK